MNFVTRSEEETIALARRLAGSLPAGVYVLTGNLGAGKTTFVKGLAAGLEAVPEEEVSSPTFTLIHEYGEPVNVYHVDLYRLEEPREALSLGLEELYASGAFVLVEWGERFPEALPGDAGRIVIERTGEEERRISVTLPCPRTVR